MGEISVKPARGEPKTRKCQLCGRRYELRSGLLSFTRLRPDGPQRWYCWQCRQTPLPFYGHA